MEACMDKIQLCYKTNCKSNMNERETQEEFIMAAGAKSHGILNQESIMHEY